MGGGGNTPKPAPLPVQEKPEPPATPAATPETRKARNKREEQARLAFGRQGAITNVVGGLGLAGQAFAGENKSLLGV